MGRRERDGRSESYTHPPRLRQRRVRNKLLILLYISHNPFWVTIKLYIMIWGSERAVTRHLILYSRAGGRGEVIY